MTLNAAHASDLARRVAHRRHELELTLEEVARRAGMTPEYLDYLEHAPAIDIPRGALIRLAGALETSVDSLRGGKVDRPPHPARNYEIAGDEPSTPGSATSSSSSGARMRIASSGGQPLSTSSTSSWRS
jgi:transcriptional regulator with XRE-family HTH domain